jgi:hypothetical protein
MHGKYIFSALVVILLVCAPGAAITTKIAAGAPVYIGETNLNIASAIGECHIIAWWPDSSDLSGFAVRNITIKQLNEGTGLATRFNISPELFSNYTGNWYCEDKQPHFVVLTVMKPAITLRIWDIDSDQDVSGQSVPYSANITYRIDTNLNLAMDYYNRTDLTPADSFFTVKLTDPSGGQISNIYTDSVGKATTQILTFDSNPFITTPIYLGSNMNGWNHLSRDASGTLIYPPGTYTITVTQNLNNMRKAYMASGVTDLDGITSSSAQVTFLPRDPLSGTTAATPNPEEIATVTDTVQPVETSPADTVTGTVPMTSAPETIPVTGKATYSPLPVWAGIAGLLCAVILLRQNP